MFRARTQQKPMDERAIYAAKLVAGAVAFFIGWWIWRGIIGVPLEFKPLSVGITLDGGIPFTAMPWAPWWVVPTASALLGTLIWRRAAVRKGRTSVFRSMNGMVLVCVFVFPISTFALELGAIVQIDPLPSIWTVLTLVPAMAAEGAGIALLNLAFNGMVLLPAAAIMGLIPAAVASILARHYG